VVLLSCAPGPGGGFSALAWPLAGDYRAGMNRRCLRLLLIGLCLWLLPQRCPAPLIYTPGEGWTYEPVGGEGKWQRARAKDQLIVAQDAFDRQDYGLALRAARRVVKTWPLSDYTPQAQYLVGRCYEVRGLDQKAFKEYQKLLDKYPKATHYEDVLKRQYDIACRFLAGKWFRVLTYIPLFPSMSRTAGLFEQIVKNGPYSNIAPQAQLRIGEAWEKKSDFPEAVKAFQRAADRYNDRPQIAADAVFRMAQAQNRQARSAEYDQSTAGQAIATFTDFMTLYPDDPRVPQAQKAITALRTEQARGNFEIARYYEHNKRWGGALVYYNEVLLRDPNSPYAAQARERIDAIKRRLQGTAP
jgi:outer membrane protein assembly factor BamD